MDNTKPLNPPEPVLATLLSLLLPGLGQLYCGNLVRALAFACAALFAGAVLAGLMMQTRALIPSLVTTLALGFAVSLASAIDAYRLAKRSNGLRSPAINRPLVYCLFALLNFGADLGGAFGLSLLVHDRFVEAYVIPSKDMMPTILPGDRILAFKQIYLETDPRRGDLVIFKAPGMRTRNWIKRVIALPGETVAIRRGKLFINGKESEPHGYEVTGMETVADFAEITVPDFHCFVLGDNRASSQDSRVFGSLGFGSITARVESRFWPLNRAGSLRVNETEN